MDTARRRSYERLLDAGIIADAPKVPKLNLNVLSNELDHT